MRQNHKCDNGHGKEYFTQSLFKCSYVKLSLINQLFSGLKSSPVSIIIICMHAVMSTKMVAHPVNRTCHNGGTPQQSDTMLRYFLINPQTLNGSQISMAGKVISIVYCRNISTEKLMVVYHHG